MTADVVFYVELARGADGPLVELAIGNCRVAIPVAQATGRSVIGIDSSQAMLEQARARAAEAGVELDLREGDMRDLTLDEPASLIYCPFRACTWRPGPTAAAPSNASQHRCGRTDVSPGTLSPSTTSSRRAWTASTRTSPYHTRTGTPSATTGSTSRSTTAEKAPSGGRRRTSGSGSSMSPAFRWRRSTAALPASHSETTAGSTSSSPAAKADSIRPNRRDAQGKLPRRRPRRCGTLAQ